MKRIVPVLVASLGIIGAPAAATAAGSAPAPVETPRVETPRIETTEAGTAESPHVEAGDLSHLTYTATGELHANLVSPQVDGVVSHASTRVDVSTESGAGVELAVNGVVVPVSHLGERNVDAKLNIARYSYYAVPFNPGPNDVALTPLGAAGLRGETVHAVVYGAGRSVRLTSTLEGKLVADAHSRARLHVVALDAWDHPAASSMPVRIAVVGGDALLAKPESTDRVGTTAIEVALDDRGATDIVVMPGATSGNVTLTILSGEAHITRTLFLSPYLHRAFVTGLVTVGAGSVPGDRDGDGNLDAGGSRRARVALYGSGATLRDTSLTFAYDTASRLAPTSTNGPYIDNPLDRPFQTYGDTSTRRDDALSAARLYTRIEHGHDSLTYGRFTADIGGEGNTSSYQQVLSGTRVELADQSDRLHAAAFTARNDVAYARETLDTTGLSVLGRTLHSSIVVGSDIVSLVAIDRITGGVVSQRVLERNADYVLDYVSGTLRFIEVPLPYDANLNHQIVVIQYQYAGDGSARVLGAKAQLHFGRDGGSAVRLGYVNDSSGAGNFSLFEQAASGLLRTTGAWSIVHTSLAGFAPSSGSGLSTAGGSLHAALTATIRGTKFVVSAESTGAGFTNPYGSFSTPGFGDYRANAARTLRGRGVLTFGYDAQSNHGIGADSTQTDIAIALKQPINKRLTLTGGLNRRHQSGIQSQSIVPVQNAEGTLPITLPTTTSLQAPVTASATQASFGAEYKLRDHSTFSLSRVQNLGSTEGASLSQPAQTQAGFDLTINAATRAYLHELWTDANVPSFAGSTVNVGAASSGSRITTFGIDRKINRTTAFTTQYTLQNTGTGNEFYVLDGLRESLTLNKRLKADAFVQNAHATSAAAGASGFTAYGLTLAYAGTRIHAASSFQERTGAAGGYALQLGAGGAISPDVSLLGSLNTSLSGALKTVDGRAGLAWRPHDNDRGAALIEVERRTNNLSLGSEASNTLAAEGVYRPTTGLELNARLAYKLDGDAYYLAHSTLLGMRAVQRLGERSDLAIESRTLRVPGISGTTTTALAVESGRRLGDSMRVAIGYHFSSTADSSLARAPTRRGVYVTLTSAVSRLFGWGR